ncbi:MAG: hypothetical protein AAFX76_14770, partial [Planctomycetota bacterium]
MPDSASVPSSVLPIPDLEAGDQSQFVEAGDAVRLRAGRREQTGEWMFPLSDDAGWDVVEVGPEGVLYSFSTIHV